MHLAVVNGAANSPARFLDLFCDWQRRVVQLKIHSLQTAASPISSCTKFMSTI